MATSGKSFHPIIKYTGNTNDRVDGVIFNISAEELIKADAYEVSEKLNLFQVRTLGYMLINMKIKFLNLNFIINRI